MFKSMIQYILDNVFKINTQTTEKEINDNQKYASEYEKIDDINFNAIFSNKLANYVIADSNLNVLGDNKRSDLLNKTGQAMWKKAKKITSMGFGYGGLIIVPYVKGNKIYYNLVPQNRLTIDETDGELITGATVLAEKKTIVGKISTKTYCRWSNYKVEGNKITILQQYSDEEGNKIPTPNFWQNITESITITGVDRVLFGYIKSPINNRKSNDKYGVPITYGCEATIREIKECLKQIVREYDTKQSIILVDKTAFGKDGNMANSGIFQKLDAGDENFYQVFDPSIRESSYYARLQELYQRLEHEIGTSAGILSEPKTQNATATEIKRSTYDTFTIVDDMRSNIEQGLEDFFYACNVLANAFNLGPQGDYEISYDWSYTLLQDTQQEFSNLLIGVSKGVISKSELRQWLKPNETIDESTKAIEEIKANEPNIQDLLGTNLDSNEE